MGLSQAEAISAHTRVWTQSEEFQQSSLHALRVGSKVSSKGQEACIHAKAAWDSLCNLRGGTWPLWSGSSLVTGVPISFVYLSHQGRPCEQESIPKDGRTKRTHTGWAWQPLQEVNPGGGALPILPILPILPS